MKRRRIVIVPQDPAVPVTQIEGAWLGVDAENGILRVRRMQDDADRMGTDRMDVFIFPLTTIQRAEMSDVP